MRLFYTRQHTRIFERARAALSAATAFFVVAVAGYPLFKMVFA